MRRHLHKIGYTLAALLFAYIIVSAVVAYGRYVNPASVAVVLVGGAPLIYAGVKVERWSVPHITTKGAIWLRAALRALVYITAIVILGAAMWLNSILTSVYVNVAVAFLPLLLLNWYWITRRQYTPDPEGDVGVLVYKGVSPIGWRVRLIMCVIAGTSAFIATSVELEWLENMLN